MEKTEAEKFAFEIIKTIAPMVVSTFDESGYSYQRAVFNLQASEGVHEVLFSTHKSSKKVQQIKKNPKGSVYLFNPEKFLSAAFIGDFKICDDMETKKKYWKDSFKQNGYSGVDDPEYVVVKMCTKKVRVLGHGFKSGEFDVEQKKCCGCNCDKK